ncbi:MAG: methyltransferase [Fimbriimonadaceae bacterium]|nr:methyltransferase [Chitinophagales bacterium]
MKDGTFYFKQFSVKHHESGMKVGTDAILLGAWTSLEIKGKNKYTNILDIGTGTGVLALMLAQRAKSCLVDAIDLDAFAYEECLLNVRNSGFKNNELVQSVQCFHSSLQEWIRYCNKKYDILICNPPFYYKGFPVADEKRNKARAAENLLPENLITAAKKLLYNDGILSVIYPVREGERFLQMCIETNLYCKRKTTVYPKENKPAKRILLEITSTQSETKTDTIIIEHEGQHNYTEQYKNLTKEFYLHF